MRAFPCVPSKFQPEYPGRYRMICRGTGTAAAKWGAGIRAVVTRLKYLYLDESPTDWTALGSFAAEDMFVWRQETVKLTICSS